MWRVYFVIYSASLNPVFSILPMVVNGVINQDYYNGRVIGNKKAVSFKLEEVSSD